MLSSMLFQSIAVLTKKAFVYCSDLASGTFTLLLLIRDCLVTLFAVVKLLWSNLSFSFVPCCEVRWRRWYLPFCHLVEEYETLVFPSFFQCGKQGRIQWGKYPHKIFAHRSARRDYFRCPPPLVEMLDPPLVRFSSFSILAIHPSSLDLWQTNKKGFWFLKGDGPLCLTPGSSPEVLLNYFM